MKILTTILLTIFLGLILSFSVRGIPGNPNTQNINQAYWKDDGPLELSPERGKFALTYAMVEENSFFFSEQIARFATPDLGYHNGKFVSLFAPGVSFITAPGYILGKEYGISQVGTFGVIALFALLNVLLIRAILLNLKVGNIPSTLASLSFLFATPAFSYAASLYQHHISTFIILLSVYLLIKFKGIWPLSIIWFLLAVSLTIDSPNFFLVFPIGIFALGRFIYAKVVENKLKIGIKLLGFLTVTAAIVPLFYFTWFNQISYGNPFQLSGTVVAVKALDEKGNPAQPEDTQSKAPRVYNDSTEKNKSAVGFFQTRRLLNGFYIHLFSPDRGIIIYAPLMFLALLGIYFIYKKHKAMTALLLSIIGVNFLLYSMWGDPWGGWGFGSRYLIPSYALLSIFLGFVLFNLNRYILFSAVFLLIFGYSVAINTVGAITSSRNPPQIEVLGLEKLSGIEQKYTYSRNFDMLESGKSKAFMFNAIVKNSLSAWNYYYLILASIMIPSSLLLIIDVVLKKFKRGGEVSYAENK